MKKHILFSTLLLLFSANIFALEVYKSELESGSGDKTIEFINYSGPHKKIDSVSAIKGIGSGLGEVIAKSTETGTTAGASTKYYVIHAVDENEKSKLDADIIILGEDAGVDHIVNLRRIISAYLSSAYNYDEKDADTLAVFITVYNAVYRGNLESFQNKYKTIVTNNLSQEKCGLSVNFEDWPGKTQIVIPLFDVKNGGLSTVDTSVISDKNVVQSMKEDDDRNIESRKDMVDLKEREADNATEIAQEAQRNATEEQNKLNEEHEKTLLAQQEAAEAEQQAKDAQDLANQNPKDKDAKKAAEEAKENADQKKEAAAKQSEKESEQKAKTDKARDTAEEKQKIADKKNSESQSERQEIAKDQKAVQDKKLEEANIQSEYGLILSDKAKLFSRIVKFNSKNGKIIKSSPVAVIRNRTIYKSGNNYIAIAGENKGKSAVKLVLIDSEKLEIVGESDDTIAEDSVLVQDGADYYCVINLNKKFLIAKFDANATLKVKSTVEVTSSTPITVTANGIVITDSSGKLKLLDKQNLKEISE